MTADEMIAVLQAYKEGKTIQFAFKTDGKFAYTIPKGAGEVNWDFKECNYRVKPEPHYRPFESAEEVVEVIREHGNIIKIKSLPYHYQWITGIAPNCKVVTYCDSIPFDRGFSAFIFADGTPFGKLVEE